jgi:hypothetical protein
MSFRASFVAWSRRLRYPLAALIGALLMLAMGQLYASVGGS